TFTKLLVGSNHPMHIRRFRVPVTARVFALFVSLFSTGTDQRLLTQQMTHTTRVRILAARSIVAASRFYCLTTRKRTQQLAEQSRLSNLARKSTDTDHYWPIHFIYRRFLLGVIWGALIFNTPRASL